MWTRLDLVALGIVVAGLLGSVATAQTEQPHGEIEVECSACHTTSGWTPLREPLLFEHDDTGFPLRAAHEAVSCRDCHADLVFSAAAETGGACSSCHQAAFEGATDPDHVRAGFSTSCESCHSAVSWQGANGFDHSSTGFVLEGGHSNLECNLCHREGFSGTPADCFSCHQADFQSVSDPNHVQAGFSTNCESCHAVRAWEPATFDHNQTGFVLEGGHRGVDCLECHQEGYSGTPTDCFSCHQADFQSVSDPNHVQAGFSTNCESCHAVRAWEPAIFDHNQTGFQLDGGHRGVDCLECHQEGYSGTPTDCFSCHQADYQGVSDPNHVQAGFSTNCESCHAVRAWEPATFDHNQTGFVLEGGHRGVDCLECHQNGYSGTPTDCFSCHQADFQSVSDPNHVQAGFSTNCESCHAVRAWEPATFDHNQTGFVLEGGHRGVDCLECHQEGYSGTPTDCFSCHQADFQSVSDPNHVQAGFSTNCESCHAVRAWEPAIFDHNQTGFQLDGGHRGVDCLECHQNGYSGTPTDCFSCHQADFQSVSDPNHVQAGFSTNCESCHAVRAWEPATFDHNQTGFVLEGGHRGVDCLECHQEGYSGTPTDCFSCHQADFQSVSDPNHVQAGFSTNCESCHAVRAWEPAIFDHNQTGFQLDGGHRGVDCLECHQNGYSGTPTDCFSCHQADYQGVSDPNHVQAGFSTNCESCHAVRAWEPAIFDHNQTGFQLDGGHRGVDCLECHQNGYSGTPTDCFSCHQADFQSVSDPNHVQAGFSTNCESCHTVRAWEPATFNHAQTAFPLSGGHRGVDCLECHQRGYSGTPTDCFSCHESDYQSVTNPNHATAGFSTRCESCHTTSAWTPANFDHNQTAFPLTGTHRVIDCVECHVAGSYTGTPTDCFSCHQPDYQQTANPNHANAGFPTACETCHSTQGWAPATFDHNQTAFPLVASHRVVDCVECHVGGVYTGTPIDCYSCHTADYNRTRNPNHASAGFPTNCESCHQPTDWTDANFDHDAQFFPIYSGKHRGKWQNCDDCHVSPGNFRVFECILCHEHNRSDTDRDHSEVSGYRYVSTSCLSCHPDGES